MTKEMENVKVTVVIPIYNVEEYLVECLESVINQTYQNLEIICVEDKSTDNSLDILYQYVERDSRIQLFCNAENKGLAYSRNVGLNIAKGEYVLFVDSDDYITEDLITMCIQNVDDNDIVCFNYVQFDDIHGYQTPHRYKMEDGKYEGKSYFVESVMNDSIVFSAWSKFYRRAFLDNNDIRFCDGLLYEDILFSFTCFLKASGIYSLSKQAYWYRIRYDSIMTKKIAEQNLESYFFIICELARYYINEDYKEVCNAIQRYIQKVAQDFIGAYRKSGEKRVKGQLLKKCNTKYLKLYNTFADLCVRSGILEDISQNDLGYIKSFRYVILYGAGDIGRSILEILDLHDISIYGIAVTTISENRSSLMGNRIRSIDDYKEIEKDECLVIIAVTEKYNAEVVKKIKNNGFHHYIKLQEW